MTFLTWRQVDFGGVVLAGLVAGYVMALAGLWAGRLPGLVSIDIADFGRRYMVSDRPSAWLFGMGSHLANSVILTLIWAAAIRPNLAPDLLSGLLWGEVLALGLAGLLAAPLSGLGILGLKRGGVRFLVTSLGLHAAWGVTIALVYP